MNRRDRFCRLLAPLLFYLHTTFVLGLLRGRVTPWISPSRNPGETLPLRTAVQMFWLPGIAALGLTALAWLIVPSFLVYLLAIIVGWMIAIPLATWNSMPQKTRTIWSKRIPVEDLALFRHFELGGQNAALVKLRQQGGAALARNAQPAHYIGLEQ